MVTISRENIEAVRRLLETPVKPDFSDAELERLVHRDVHLDLTVREINPASYDGYEGVREFVRDLFDIWDEWEFAGPFELLPAGDDGVLAIYTLRGRGRSSGVMVEMPVFNAFTVRDGKVVRMKSYRDRSAALEGTGLQENVEKLRASLEKLDLEAWKRGEGDMSLLDPEVAYEDTTLPDHVGETYRGHEGVARATGRWLEPYERLTIELEQIVGADDRLVSIHRVWGKARHTGIVAEGPLAYVWTFRDGKVIHFRSYRDPGEALEAAGLRER